MRVHGTGTADEAGVVRCYLEDLAHRNTAGLAAISDSPTTRITASDLTFAADARAGLATADLAPSTISVSIVGITITYANGAKESAVLVNMQAMGGPSTWRMDLN